MANENNGGSDQSITGTVRIEQIERTDDKLATTVTVSGDAADVIQRVATRPTKVSLDRTPIIETPDQALWSAIRDRTNAIAFDRYYAFINRVLCEYEVRNDSRKDVDIGRAACPPRPCDADNATSAGRDDPRARDIGSPSVADRRKELAQRPGIYGVDAYHLLRLATQAFLLFETGVVIEGLRHPMTGKFVVPNPNVPDEHGFELRDRTCTDELPEEQRRLLRDAPVNFGEIQEELAEYLATSVGNVSGRALPYLKRIVSALPSLSSSDEGLPYCKTILQHRFTCPSLLELIWSYWHEEGMLVQTMNALSMRFQNRRNGPRDPLVNLELDPLRPLNNLLWGFIQDEYNRLSVQRRAYEYDHHYGLTLYGKAVTKLDSADSRSRFIEAFHNLLHRAAMFYREDDDTTVIADAFAMLNALREVHLILAEGAHNQFGDLPWTARAEMLIMQWLLARPEIREFIRGRHMVPYQEIWMGAVDDMKRLQGWTDVTVTHFRELGVHGEQILLSIRYADWIVENDQERARNWARYWRPEIQRYMHAYYAATGVDLTTDITDTRIAADRYLQPSVHLRKRLTAQERKGLPPAKGAGKLAELSDDYLELSVQGRQRLLTRGSED